MMNDAIGIQACSILCSLGDQPDQLLQGLHDGDFSGMRARRRLHRGRSVPVGAVAQDLPPLPDSLNRYECRNNRLLQACYRKLEPACQAAIERYGASRVGVIMGTSTSGISQGEHAVAFRRQHGALPDDYHYCQQEVGAVSHVLAALSGVEGPAYTVSTACSSGAKVFAAARRMLHAGLVDACLVGGCDSLCDLTLNGFDALEQMASEVSNPFSVRRNGINIGEAAGLFLLSREPAPIQLLGVGESSDAHHMSAPQPQGLGAEQAMRSALTQAGLRASDIAYVNLHGTGTRLNDAMESHAMARVFGAGEVACSSTKPLTGHTLGAAGAIEVGFACLTLSRANGQGRLPRQCWDGQIDPELSPLALVDASHRLTGDVLMSNSYAFGGSNVSVIVGRKR